MSRAGSTEQQTRRSQLIPPHVLPPFSCFIAWFARYSSPARQKTCLARFGGHDILIIDERSEPTTAGRADGIQPRVSGLELCLAHRQSAASLRMINRLTFARHLPCYAPGTQTIEVLRNMEPLGTEFYDRSAASYERTFWDPRSDGKRGIERSRRVQR